MISRNGETFYYRHKKLGDSFHGTGDVYASAFTGAYMQGFTTYEAAKIAADYVVQSMKNTIGDDTHWYGVKFETAIPSLIKALNL